MSAFTHRNWLWCCFLLALVSTSAFAQDEVDDSLVPQRPAANLLDSARVFTSSERESIGEGLERHMLKYGVDIFVVTRLYDPPQGAETYCRQLARVWTKRNVWCVIYVVPDDPSSFHVEYHVGKSSQIVGVDDAIKEGIGRARKEISQKDRVMAVITECKDSLRFAQGAQNLRAESAVKNNTKKQKQTAHLIRRKKIILAAAAASILFVACLLGWLMIRNKNKITEFEFPNTSWKSRLKGPHCGGNGIVVNYRSKQLK